MESGASKKFISPYWFTWIVLLAAPVVSAWGSQDSNDSTPKKPTGAKVCEDDHGQFCANQAIRDNLIFQFIYHSNYANTVSALVKDIELKERKRENSDQLQDTLKNNLNHFCVDTNQNILDCSRLWLVIQKTKLEQLKYEIRRFDDVLVRLDSGRIQFGAPNTRSTDAIYYLDPTSIEDLQSAFNQEKKRLPKPGEPSRFDVYTEWRDHILAEPKKHHFPKLISGKDKKGDPTVRIDRSCPMNQGNVCYDLDAYSRAIANFKYNNSKFMLKQELGSPARVDTATNPEWNGSSLASQALTSARETVISKIEGKAWGVIKSDGNAAVIDQPQQRSPAQAVSSTARTVKLPRTYKHDVHLTVSDEYMRSLIDSIQF